jgi:uncharacterized protein Yka (UPF0111/DUF47 family)
MADEQKEKMITIKHGKMELKVPRSELVELSETADGVVFQFKDGVSLEKMDQYMPNAAKQLMKNSADSFPQANLVFNLDDYSKPVLADMD